MGLTYFHRSIDLAFPGEITEIRTQWDIEISDRIGNFRTAGTRLRLRRVLHAQFPCPAADSLWRTELSHGGFKKIKSKLVFYRNYKRKFQEKFDLEDFQGSVSLPERQATRSGLFEDIDDEGSARGSSPTGRAMRRTPRKDLVESKRPGGQDVFADRKGRVN